MRAFEKEHAMGALDRRITELISIANGKAHDAVHLRRQADDADKESAQARAEAESLRRALDGIRYLEAE